MSSDTTTFKLSIRERNIDKEHLLNDLRRVTSHLNQKSITKLQYDEYGCFGATTFLRRFGTWNNALALAGLDVVCRQNIPNNELFENLADVWRHNGRQPTGRDLEKSNGISKFSTGTYEKRFGSWNKALRHFIEHIQEDTSDLKDSSPAGQKKQSATRTSRKINWRLRVTVLIRDNCICKICGVSPAKDPSVTLHVDHILPWSKGGETVINNLQTLCHVCNIGKSDLLLSKKE